MTDYYNTLGIEEQYHLDLNALKTIYLKLSKQHHPDFSQGDPAEQQKRLLRFSEINDAYKKLSDPHSRLLTLFTRYGLLEADGQIADQQKLSQEFLMEMMTHNMALEEVMASDDAQAANDFRRTLNGLMEERNTAIEAAMTEFDAADAPDARKAALQKALPAFFERRYLLRMDEKLTNFADSADDD